MKEIFSSNVLFLRTIASLTRAQFVMFLFCLLRCRHRRPPLVRRRRRGRLERCLLPQRAAEAPPVLPQDDRRGSGEVRGAHMEQAMNWSFLWESESLLNKVHPKNDVTLQNYLKVQPNYQ